MAESKSENTDLTSKLLATKAKLDAVSPSFCLAKWTQVTLHLQTGFTHSCHHPIPHKIPLEEIKKDPSALHNTLFKKQQREMMLKGQRPPECAYCWNIEDSPGQNISDRYLKSHDTWSAPYFNEIKNLPAKNNYNPRYLEVSFSHACNFKCIYCVPDVSSKWFEEIKQFGGYKTSHNHNSLDNLKAVDKMPYDVDAPNPYVDAFWKWWPQIAADLKVFRITGGEPLLSKSTFRTFEYFSEHPNLDLDFAINSNLGVPFGLVEKMAMHIEDLLGLSGDKKQKVKSFVLFTSVDTHGASAEYIRTGMKYAELIKNIEYLLKRIPTLKIVIMCTMNALSLPYFSGLVLDVARLKKDYFDTRRFGPSVTLDISYLRMPPFLSIKILPAKYAEYLDKPLELMKQNSEAHSGLGIGYSEYEISKMSRLINYMSAPVSANWLKNRRRNFAIFIKEFDRRRGTNIEHVLPELKSFYDYCLTLIDSPDEYSVMAEDL